MACLISDHAAGRGPCELAGSLDVFWIGSDGPVATTWANPQVNSGTWHASFPISPAGAAHADSSVCVSTRFQGALDVFWVGPDGAVATTWANPQIDRGNWHSPLPITGPHAAGAVATVAAVTRHNGYANTNVVMGRSVFAVARNEDPTDLQVLYDFSVYKDGGKFLNVAFAEVRSEFERDRDRTVYSAPVRRLIGKTQVFLLDRQTWRTPPLSADSGYDGT